MSRKYKRCVVCLNEFKGRTDKKYCSRQCKTTKNNQNVKSTLFYKIDKALKHNRKVLIEFHKIGISNVTLTQLDQRAFDWTYVTGFKFEQVTATSQNSRTIWEYQVFEFTLVLDAQDSYFLYKRN